MSVLDNLNVYLVGGAVRDALLSQPVVERDWVVVGATPEDMLTRGFKQVGNDFPVFLHPKTGEEYALARTERKTGIGHQAFAFDTSESVTLEEDLTRRDLTINAIAQTPDGGLVDPCGGQADLEARVLRHIGPAFSEDPLRVLRVARFAARLAPLGFTLAPETEALMREISESGELDSLSPERVWSELSRALMSSTPSVFIETLRTCGALKVLLPEIDGLFGVPQPEQWHPEIDSGLHTQLALDYAADQGFSGPVRFAVLLHDLGKAETPVELLPKHHGHEASSARLAAKVGERLRAPKQWITLATNVARFHLHAHTAQELRPKTLLKLLTELGALRDPDHLERFLEACVADARGRTGLENREYPQADFLRGALHAVSDVDTAEIAKTGVTGAAFGEALQAERIRKLRAYRQANT
ncbi:MAG: multifunctional CCA addition/repair protein [Pseudomonadota bacterium]